MDLHLSIHTNPSNGLLENCLQEQKTAISCTYIPNKDFNGTDVITVITVDGDIQSPPSKITIKVNSVFDAPEAVEQNSIELPAGTSRIFNITSANTIEKEELFYEVVSGPKKGVLSKCFESNDILSCTYTPEIYYVGEDAFTIRAVGKSSGLASASMEVLIRVTDFLVPIGRNESLIIPEDQEKEFTYTVNSLPNSKNLKVSIKSGPVNGKLENCQNTSLNTQKCTYRPDPNYVGSDAVIFEVSDGTFKASNTSRLNITVTSVLDAPVLGAQNAINVLQGQTAKFNINRATTAEKELIEYVIQTSPSKGVLSGCLSTLNAQSVSCSYQATVTGSDSFSIIARGVTSRLASAAMNINVNIAIPQPRDMMFSTITEERSLKERPKIDLLLVVDDSRSMAKYQESLAPKVGAMISSLKGTNTDIQVITTSLFDTMGMGPAQSSIYRKSATNTNGLFSYTLDVNQNHAKKFSIKAVQTDLTTVSSEIETYIRSLGIMGNPSERPALTSQLVLDSPLFAQAKFGAVIFLGDESDDTTNSFGLFVNETERALNKALYQEYTGFVNGSETIQSLCVAGQISPYPAYRYSPRTLNFSLSYSNPTSTLSKTYVCKKDIPDELCSNKEICTNAQVEFLNKDISLAGHVSCKTNLTSPITSIMPTLPNSFSCTDFLRDHGTGSTCKVESWEYKTLPIYDVSGISYNLKNKPQDYVNYLKTKFGENNYFFSAIVSTTLTSKEACNYLNRNGAWYICVASLIPTERKHLLSILDADYTPAMDKIKDFVILKTINSFNFSLLLGESIQSILG